MELEPTACRDDSLPVSKDCRLTVDYYRVVRKCGVYW